jgi:hypothetical protein
LAKSYLAPIFSEGTAIVDLNWTGKTQSAIELILGKGVSGYFIGLFQRKFQTIGVQCAFLFNENERDRSGEYLDCVSFEIGFHLEVFAPAPHGSVLSYSEGERGTVVVSYDTERNTAQSSEVSLSFYNEFSEAMPSEITCEFERTETIALEILNGFLREPNEEEAESWGSLHFKDIDSEVEIAPLMKPLELRSIIKVLLGGIFSYGMTHWPIATRRRTPFVRLFIYRCLFFYRHRVVRLLVGSKVGRFAMNFILRIRKGKTPYEQAFRR